VSRPLPGDPPWSPWLDPRELAAVRDSQAWFQRPAGTLSRLMGLVERPLELAWQKVPESTRESTARAVCKALETLLETAGRAVPEQRVLDSICAEVGFEVGRSEQIRSLDVRPLDRLARRSVEAHRRAAAVEGGVSGLAGLPGLLLDIPALYSLIFRMLGEVSLIYGFPLGPSSERAHLLKVLDLGQRTDPEARRQGLEELQAVQDLLQAGVPARELEKQVVLRGLGALAEKLGTDLTRRKLAQTLAVVGSVVGAGVNYQLLGDVGETAWHAYRLRFLMQRARAREAWGTHPTRRLP